MQLRIKQDQRGISSVIVVMLSLVILVIISANVILWSYQMNQLDWEKMQENIAILSVTPIRETWFYNPSGYALGGSTSLVSGSVSDLTSDNGVYMTFRSYYSGTDTSDFVDNNTSDVDSSPDIGSHLNFTAQQYGPDNIFDILTEENTGSVSNTTLINAESFEATWPPSGWSATGNWNKESDQAYDGTYSADFDGGWWTSGELDTLGLNCSGVSAIYVEFWYYDHGCEANEVTVDYYNGINWNNIADLCSNSEDTWHFYSDKITDNQYFVSNFKVRWDANWLYWDEYFCVDLVTVKKETSDKNYELDLEIQWTSVDYDETNEELCIYAGATGSEDLHVDYWTGSTWSNILTDLTANSWNNISVSLTSTTFTIRFKGGNETGDTAQDSWNIDATLLHVWSVEYTTEVEFIGSSNTEDWTQLNWTVDSAWTASSVSVTLQLYNYTLDDYPTSGNGYMAYTSHSTPNTDENKSQTTDVNPTHFRNATGYWKMKVEGVKATDTQFDFKADWIEFKVMKVNGTLFTFKNEGSLTSHLVSLWIINSTVHQHYDISVFVNSGETLSYLHVDICLPSGEYMAKVVTERGNIAVYSGS